MWFCNQPMSTNTVMDMIENITKRYIGIFTGRSMISHLTTFQFLIDVVDFKKTMNRLPFIEVVPFSWTDLRHI